MVGLFLLKLLQLFQHRFLLRGLAARCGKLLLIQHQVDILADIFQCGQMSGCKVSSWVRSSALLDCSAENSASNAEKSTAVLPFSFIRVRTALLKASSSSLCWAGIGILCQLEVLLYKGIVDGLQLGMDGGSVLDLGDCPHPVLVLLQLPAERGGGLV